MIQEWTQKLVIMYTTASTQQEYWPYQAGLALLHHSILGSTSQKDCLV